MENSEQNIVSEEKVRKHKTKINARKIVLFFFLFLVIIFAGLTIWVYTGTVTSAKTKFVSVIPYPAATVDGHFISMRDYVHRYNVAKQFYTGQQALDEKTLKNQILDQLISEEKLKMVASKHGVSVSDKQLSNELNGAIAQVNQDGKDNFTGLLKQYGITKDEFKNQILTPELLMTNLVIWFNGQESLNQTSYNKIHAVQNQIKASTTFESLVKNNSEDQNTSQLEGDLGFVDINGMLPEFKESLDNSKVSDVYLLVSRYGLHLIKVVEKDNGGTAGSLRVHLKQIYAKTSDFNAWFTAQNSKVTTKKLVKI